LNPFPLIDLVVLFLGDVLSCSPAETQVSLRLWLPPLVISPSPMIPRQMRPATESISGTMQDCRRPRVSAFCWLFPTN
jgi:hypothetical protein